MRQEAGARFAVGAFLSHAGDGGAPLCHLSVRSPAGTPLNPVDDTDGSPAKRPRPLKSVSWPDWKGDLATEDSSQAGTLEKVWVLSPCAYPKDYWSACSPWSVVIAQLESAVDDQEALLSRHLAGGRTARSQVLPIHTSAAAAARSSTIMGTAEGLFKLLGICASALQQGRQESMVSAAVRRIAVLRAVLEHLHSQRAAAFQAGPSAPSKAPVSESPPPTREGDSSTPPPPTHADGRQGRGGRAADGPVLPPATLAPSTATAKEDDSLHLSPRAVPTPLGPLPGPATAPAPPLAQLLPGASANE